MEDLRRVREEYEAALDDAERKRAAYHEAIRKLHLSGTSLREIAEQLGLSHQRVHQIVGVEPAKKPKRLRRVAGGAGIVLVICVVAGAIVDARRTPNMDLAPAPQNFTVILEATVAEPDIRLLADQIGRGVGVTDVRWLPKSQFHELAMCHWRRHDSATDPRPAPGRSALIARTRTPTSPERVQEITRGYRDVIRSLWPGVDISAQPCGTQSG